MMKTSHRKSKRARPGLKARAADATKRRYENAWDETVPYQETVRPVDQVWRGLRRFPATRAGRVVMLSAGTLGAYLFLRRRR